MHGCLSSRRAFPGSCSEGIDRERIFSRIKRCPSQSPINMLDAGLSLLPVPKSPPARVYSTQTSVGQRPPTWAFDLSNSTSVELIDCRKSTASELTACSGIENDVQVPISVQIGHRDACRAGRINVATDREPVTIEIPKPRD